MNPHSGPYGNGCTDELLIVPAVWRNERDVLRSGPVMTPIKAGGVHALRPCLFSIVSQTTASVPGASSLLHFTVTYCTLLKLQNSKSEPEDVFDS